jgi:hypothetical protein
MAPYLLVVYDEFSWAISQVKWLSGENPNILKTVSVMRTEMVFETLVFSPLDHLIQLIA